MYKKILIMAGGTGGHIFPALAIAQELKKHDIHIEWLGSNNSMEQSIVPKYKIKLYTVSSVGIRGKNFKTLIKAPFLLTLAFFQTIAIFIKLKPQLVIGMGGFTSAIGGVIAVIMRKPLVIHEQNAIAGTTNQMLAKIATKVFQAFDNTFTSNINAITSGNPILFKPQAKQPINTPINVLVLGGSLGAKKINDTILKLQSNINIWHQTGKAHIDYVNSEYQKKTTNNNKIKTTAFIDDMASAYAWADIVICRAGAMTVAEIIATNSVAIFIPFPYAIDDHQTQNTKILTNCGAGFLLPENNLCAKKLDKMLSSIDIELTATKIRAIDKKDAIKTITDYILIPNLANNS